MPSRQKPVQQLRLSIEHQAKFNNSECSICLDKEFLERFLFLADGQNSDDENNNNWVSANVEAALEIYNNYRAL